MLEGKTVAIVKKADVVKEVGNSNGYGSRRDTRNGGWETNVGVVAVEGIRVDSDGVVMGMVDLIGGIVKGPRGGTSVERYM